MHTEGVADHKWWKDGKPASHLLSKIKVKDTKGESTVALMIQREGDIVKRLVNDVTTIEKRSIKRNSNSIGLKIGGKQKIDFDNLEIKWQ